MVPLVFKTSLETVRSPEGSTPSLLRQVTIDGRSAAAAYGLSAILATSAQAFAAVKLAGAGYLVYLGLRMLFHRVGQPASTFEDDLAKPWATYRSGFLTNLLNPKVALFFLPFLPQFVAPSADSRMLAFLFLGAVFMTTGTIWRLVLAWFGSTISRRLRRRSSTRLRLGWPMPSTSTHLRNAVERARLSQILDLFAEDNRLNVYAGKLELRPPGAPTTESDSVDLRSRARPVGNHFATSEESSARTGQALSLRPHCLFVAACESSISEKIPTCCQVGLVQDLADALP